MLDFFKNLDRRWIFLMIGFSVLIPLLLGIGSPMPTSPIVQAIYDKIESLPPGSLALISFDYGPGTEVENPVLPVSSRGCRASSRSSARRSARSVSPGYRIICCGVLKRPCKAIINGDFFDLSYPEGTNNAYSISFSASLK